MNNLCRVIKESDIDVILKNNTEKLVLTIIMFSSKDCQPCQQIKPTFISLSKENKDIYFIYVDITEFKVNHNKYTASLESTPHFVFYFGGVQIAHLSGSDSNNLCSGVIQIKKIIAEKILESKQNDNKESEHNNTSDSETSTTKVNIMQRKLNLLQKLKEFETVGCILTKPFTIESNYDDLLKEYELHVQKIRKQHQINELQKINNYLKMKQATTLQELNKIKDDREKDVKK